MEKLLYVCICKQVNEKARLLMGVTVHEKVHSFMDTWSTKVGAQAILKHQRLVVVIVQWMNLQKFTL